MTKRILTKQDKIIGNLIRMWIRYPLNQKTLAKQLDITPASLSQMLNGKVAVPRSRIHKICEILNPGQDEIDKLNRLVMEKHNINNPPESDSVREHRELQRETKFNMLSTEAIRMLREKIPEDLDPDSEEWAKTNEDFMQKRNELQALVFNRKDTGEEFSYGLIHEIAEKYGLDEAALSQSVNKESVKAVHHVMSERARVSREETQRIRDEVNNPDRQVGKVNFHDQRIGALIKSWIKPPMTMTQLASLLYVSPKNLPYILDGYSHIDRDLISSAIGILEPGKDEIKKMRDYVDEKYEEAAAKSPSERKDDPVFKAMVNELRSLPPDQQAEVLAEIRRRNETVREKKMAKEGFKKTS